MDILEFALAQRIGGHDGELVDALCQEVARLREENSRLREVVVVTHEAIDKDLTFFGPDVILSFESHAAMANVERAREAWRAVADIVTLN